MTELSCNKCMTFYSVKKDRKGNSSDLPLYCPYCGDKVATIHDNYFKKRLEP